MRIYRIARELDVSVHLVQTACKRVLDIAPSAIDEISPGSALMVVGWIQEGRFDDLRRKIQDEVRSRKDL